MLKEYKKDRIILLTTHYMDEADILGDRIGIMHEGKMTCLGTSMFLKNQFGVGYVMTIEKSDPDTNTKILAYMMARLGPDVHKVSEIAAEMTIQIPSKYCSKFKDFFEDFDNDLEKLDIQSYSISLTTLEQIFLKIGSMEHPETLLKKKGTPDDASSNDADAPEIFSNRKYSSRHSNLLNASNDNMIPDPITRNSGQLNSDKNSNKAS